MIEIWKYPFDQDLDPKEEEEYLNKDLVWIGWVHGSLISVQAGLEGFSISTRKKEEASPETKREFFSIENISEVKKMLGDNDDLIFFGFLWLDPPCFLGIDSRRKKNGNFLKIDESFEIFDEYKIRTPYIFCLSKHDAPVGLQKTIVYLLKKADNKIFNIDYSGILARSFCGTLGFRSDKYTSKIHDQRVKELLEGKINKENQNPEGGDLDI